MERNSKSSTFFKRKKSTASTNGSIPVSPSLNSAPWDTVDAKSVSSRNSQETVDSAHRWHGSQWQLAAPNAFRMSTDASARSSIYSLDSNDMPVDGETLDALFADLMSRRDWKNMPEQAKKQVMNFPPQKKWIMISQDKHLQRGLSRSGKENASPEWYVKSIIQGNVSLKQLESLGVNLRTQPVGWLEGFVSLQGPVALCKTLSSINSSTTKRDSDADREYEAVKCIKTILNQEVGAMDALKGDKCINAITGSILSTRLQTRRMVIEILTFLCYYRLPERVHKTGHSRILDAFDVLKTNVGEQGKFDAWLRSFESSLDGRGRLGSMVGANAELRSVGHSVEGVLSEYAVANLLLINAIADQTEDLKIRIHIRSCLASAGLARIFEKLAEFRQENIDAQVRIYEDHRSLDFQSIVDLDDEDEVACDLNDPVEIIAELIPRLSGPSRDHLTSTLQHLFLLRDERDEERDTLFQIVESLVSFVTVDRKLPDMGLAGTLNVSLQSMVDQLMTHNEARRALVEARDASEQAERITLERDALQAKLSLGTSGRMTKLEHQLAEAREVIENQRRYAENLRNDLDRLREIHLSTLEKSELETREIFMAVQQSETDPNRESIIGELERQLERKKAEYRLEGLAWGPSQQADHHTNQRLHAIRGQMDKIQSEAQQLEEDLDSSHVQANGQFGSSRRRTEISTRMASQRPPPDLLSEIRGKVSAADGESPERISASQQNHFSSPHSTPKRKSASEQYHFSSPHSTPNSPPSQIQLGKSPPSAPPAPPLPPNLLSSSGAASTPPPPPPPPPPFQSSSIPNAPPLPTNGVLGFSSLASENTHGSAQSQSTPLVTVINPSPNNSPIRPKKKLKQMHWEKIDNVDYTMWRQMQKKQKEIYSVLYRKGILEEVETIFAAKETKRPAMNRNKTNEKTTVIPHNLAQQFNINLYVFSSFTTQETVRRILHCDKSFIDNPNVLDFFSRDEVCNISENIIRSMAPYATDWTRPRTKSNPERDPEELSRADRIYLETCFTLRDYWKSRMRALTLVKTMDKEYEDLTNKLRVIDAGTEAVARSKKFRDLLDLILALGNFMNDAHKQASGFKIGTLQRLAFLKDDKNIMSFLHYVEMVVRTGFPELEGFVEELKDTTIAGSLSVEFVQSDCQKFMDRVRNVQMSIDFGNLSDKTKIHPEDRILLVVQPDMPEGRRKAEYLGQRLDSMNNSYEKLLRYFGEDVSDTSARSAFFKHFASFVQDYLVISFRITS